MIKLEKPMRYVLPLLAIFGIYIILNHLVFTKKVVKKEEPKKKVKDIDVVINNNKIERELRQQKINERYQEPIEPYLEQSREVVQEENKDYSVNNYMEESPLHPADFSRPDQVVPEHFLIEEQLMRQNYAEPQKCDRSLNKERTNAILKQDV